MSINEKQDSVSVVTPVLLYDVLRLCCLKIFIGSKIQFYLFYFFTFLLFYLFTFLLFYLYYNPLALSRPEASGCFMPVKSVNISS